MKKFSSLFVLLLIVIIASAQELYVGSYNIRYKNGDDRINGNGWEQRCPVISSQINFEHPDIFGTQEVLEEQLGDLLGTLPDYEYIGVGREDGIHGGEHEAIFYDKKRLRLLDHGDFWLSETPDKPGLGWDAACTRICTWGKFKDRVTHRKFYFFNLHMDHVGVVARREAAKLVVERIGQIAGTKPVVLTGDFNVDQNDEIYAIFTSSPLFKDCYTSARYCFAENGTYNAYDPDLKTESHIDHIFVSPSFTVERFGVLTNAYWVPTTESQKKLKGKDAPQQIDFSKYEKRLPSDHYPIFARLRF